MNILTRYRSHYPYKIDAFALLLSDVHIIAYFYLVMITSIRLLLPTEYTRQRIRLDSRPITVLKIQAYPLFKMLDAIVMPTWLSWSYLRPFLENYFRSQFIAQSLF